MYAHTPDAPPRWSRSCAARREVNSGSDSKGHGGRSRHWCPWTLACSKHRPSTCRRRHRYRWTPEPLITFHISATLVYSWFVRLRSVIVQPAHFHNLFLCWNHHLVKRSLSDFDKNLQNVPTLLVDMRQEYTPLSNDALNAFFNALDDASLRIRFILFFNDRYHAAHIEL